MAEALRAHFTKSFDSVYVCAGDTVNVEVASHLSAYNEDGSRHRVKGRFAKRVVTHWMRSPTFPNAQMVNYMSILDVENSLGVKKGIAVVFGEAL